MSTALAKIVVSNVKVENRVPVITNEALRKLVPTRLLPEYMSFEVSPVSNAVSNAIRRTVSGELVVRRMIADYDSVDTTDPFIIHEMVIKRLRSIPIDQSCPLDAKFELQASNDTAVIRDVKSSEIRMTFGGSKQPMKTLPFNGTFTLLTLGPGKAISIKNIVMHEATGIREGDGMHSVGINAASVAVDQQPIDMYDPAAGGISSSVANPRKWKISFTTNGDIDPRACVAAACTNIIGRIAAVQNMMSTMTSNRDEYVLVIPGETHTIGNLFMRTAYDLFPDIRAAIFSVEDIGPVCTIRVRCVEDINTVYSAIIKYLTRVFTEIRSQFA